MFSLMRASDPIPRHVRCNGLVTGVGVASVGSELLPDSKPTALALRTLIGKLRASDGVGRDDATGIGGAGCSGGGPSSTDISSRLGSSSGSRGIAGVQLNGTARG